MKKASTKPISSPSRAEKYPPPLMRFLRSNVGSRSRGRSRSSPMFVLRKKTAAIETQEPTSPKVTCMGQVRVRRSSKQQQPGKRNGAPSKRQQRCRCLNLNLNMKMNLYVNKSKQLFCHCFDGKLLKGGSCFRPDWLWKCRVGWLWKKTKIREDSVVVKTEDSKTDEFVRDKEEEEEEEDEDEEQEVKVLVSPPSTPPKNAFLLTRCRSAPYRSSSLASRFWGSPLRNEETEHEEQTTTTTTTDPTSGTESSCRDSDQESRMDPETEEKHVSEKKTQTEEEKEEEEPLTAPRPITLTRCKSEPARTGQRLDPDLYILKKKRLGFT